MFNEQHTDIIDKLYTLVQSKKNKVSEEPITVNNVCAPAYDDGRNNCLKDLLGKDDESDEGLCRLERIKQVDPELAEGLKKRYFRPSINMKWLQDGNTWLKTNEITSVLDQYQDVLKDFYSFGAIAANFMDLERWHVFKQRAHEFDKIGGVMNMDPSWQSGSHWVAFYAQHDLFYYYDSSGHKPIESIKTMFKHLKDMKWLNPDVELHYNTVQHQYGNSECGMFSLIFVIMSLEKGNPEEQCKRFLYPHSDDLVQSYRFKLYVQPKSCNLR